MNGLLNAMLVDAPAVLWPLTEPAGATVIEDATANNRDGDASGVTFAGATGASSALPGLKTPTWTAGAYVNRGAESALNGGTGEWCFEFFFRGLLATGTLWEMVNRDQGSSGFGQLLRVNGSGVLYTNTAGTSHTSTAPRVTDGERHHVIYQRRAGQVEIWQDGVRYLNAANAGDVNASGTSNLRIGPTPSDGQAAPAGATFGFFAYYVGTSLSADRIAVHLAEGRRTGVTY